MNHKTFFPIEALHRHGPVPVNPPRVIQEIGKDIGNQFIGLFFILRERRGGFGQRRDRSLRVVSMVSPLAISYLLSESFFSKGLLLHVSSTVEAPPDAGL